jgi:tripartite-type tricarboxylate transporter receptor subunit TctC
MSVARGIAILSAFLAIGVHAQPYPQKAVRIIVPYVAGGDTDIGARSSLSSRTGRVPVA